MKRTLRLAAATALVSTLGCSAPTQFAPHEPTAAGVRWLLEHQTPAGSWGPHGATALATEALERFGQTDAVLRGRGWLGAVPSPRDPFAAAARVRLFTARMCGLPPRAQGTRGAKACASATPSLETLGGAQRGDGRWRSPAHPDALLTALALATLHRAGAQVDDEGLQRGRAWLLEQPVSPAWILVGVAEPARAAARRIRAAREARLLDHDRVEAQALRQLGVPEPRARLLAAAHRLDASWPEQAHLRTLARSSLSPHDLLGLLLVTEALADAPAPRRRSWALALRRLLRAEQRPDGSWCGSAFATAAALLGLDRLHDVQAREGASPSPTRAVGAPGDR